MAFTLALMFAVVITGPPGAGKSAVATAVHDLLGDAGVANALMEVDELERCYPPRDEARVLENLATICASYRDTGYELLFVTATIEADAYRERLLAAVGATAHLLIRVEADPGTLERRIREREPVEWSGTDGLVAAAIRLAAEMPSLGGVDLVLSTEQQPPAVLAAQIRDAIADRVASSE